MTGKAMLIAALLAGAAAPSTLAQTTGTPNGGFSTIVADGTTRTAIQGGDGGTIVIGGGSIAGDNLFHSFGQFDLAQGETAAWVGPGSIANVINRVTGTTASHIDGTIDTSAMPLADFWFINPNGVLFGQGAAFNVPGAMYFSTATDLRFADGDVFSARTERGSTLSISNPSSFGFIGGEAAIAMTGVGSDPLDLLTSGAAATSRLALVAPQLSVAQTGLLLEEASFLAVGDATVVPADNGTLPFLDGALGLDGSSIIVTGGNTALGQSRFAGGTLVVSQSDIGTRTTDAVGNDIAFLAAETLDVDSSVLTSRTTASGEGGALTLSAGDALRINASTLGSGAIGAIDGSGGSVSLFSGGSIELADTTVIAFSEGAGAGGEISMLADGDLSLTATNVFSQADGGGAGGELNLFASGSLILDTATLAADTSGEGAGGRISALAVGPLIATGSTISTNTTGLETSGPGGSVSIGSAADIRFSDVAVTAASLGNGNGGTVFVNAGTDLVIDDSQFLSQSLATGGTGAAGSILLRSTRDTALTGTTITADTFGFGEGGDISISADRALSLTGGSVSSDTVGDVGGDGGFVLLSAGGSATLRDAVVSTDTFGSGAGGSVRVKAGGALAIRSTAISADTVGGAGAGGFVFVTAGSTLLAEDAQIFADTYANGQGGDVLVNATGALTVQGGYISAESLSRAATGGGDGGSVALVSDAAIRIDGGARISTDALGSGAAGVVGIETPAALTVTGGATLVSETKGSGEGGVVSIEVDRLDLTGAQITANTSGSGDSLGVLVVVREAIIGAGGLITSASTGAGDAGTVYIGGEIASGAAAELVRVTDGGSVTASATGTGRAGSVRIVTDRLEVLGGGEITTSSTNALPAGAIVIDAGSLLVDGLGAADEPSRIVSENLFAGTVPGGGNLGGDVLITTGDATISNGGQLNTNSRTGNAGFISLDFADSGGILRLLGRGGRGTIRTDSGTGSGGEIRIAGAYAIIADGSEISASGDVSNAFVSIDPVTVRISSTDNTNIVNVSGIAAVAPEQDVGSATTVAEVPFIDASGVLQGRCAAARAQGRASRLDVQELGPYSLSVQVDEAYRRVAARTRTGVCL